MPTWPATLPQNQFVGVSIQDVDAVQRNTMDAGPPTRRNRFTKHYSMVTCPIVLTGLQLMELQEFYREDLHNGALKFDWTDPVTDEAVEYAFKSPPKFTMIRGGSTTAARVYRGELELEQQP